MPHPLVVHCKRSEYDVYIGRPSKWGNIFTHIRSVADKHNLILVDSREEAVEKYEDWILRQPTMCADLHELKGKVLGCWCAPKLCHGDVLARLAKDETI